MVSSTAEGDFTRTAESAPASASGSREPCHGNTLVTLHTRGGVGRVTIEGGVDRWNDLSLAEAYRLQDLLNFGVSVALDGDAADLRDCLNDLWPNRTDPSHLYVDDFAYAAVPTAGPEFQVGVWPRPVST